MGNRQNKESVNEHGLTALQEQFCHAYLLKFSVPQAEKAVRIGKGTGAKWLAQLKIRERITKIRIETGQAFDITREKMLQELMCIIYADPRKVIVDDIVDWGDEEAAAIASVEYDLMGGLKKITRWDKLKAMEILNKMLGYNMPETTKNLNVNTHPIDPKDAIEISKMLKTAV